MKSIFYLASANNLTTLSTWIYTSMDVKILIKLLLPNLVQIINIYYLI